MQKRYVDTHTEGVCAADHGEQPALRELLHEEPVARKHARVVHSHAHEQQATQGLAEARGEARVGEGVYRRRNKSGDAFVHIERKFRENDPIDYGW